MSADLDALDRGVIEAGQLAAEALSRVVALEAKVAALCRAEEIIRNAGRPAPPARSARPWRRHLKTVR